MDLNYTKLSSTSNYEVNNTAVIIDHPEGNNKAI